MAEDVKENVKNRLAWLRLFFILVFALLFYVTSIVLAVTVVVQFGFVLLGGRANAQLQRFGRSLGRYLDEMVQYATFNSDRRPFPFSDFPSGDATPATTRSGSRRSGGSRSPSRSRRSSSTRTSRSGTTGGSSSSGGSGT